MTTSLISEDDLLSAGEHLQRLLAIVGGDHGIAVAGQRALGDVADHRLVLDQQHRAAAPQLIFLRLGRLARLAGARLLAVDRQGRW